MGLYFRGAIRHSQLKFGNIPNLPLPHTRFDKSHSFGLPMFRPSFAGPQHMLFEGMSAWVRFALLHTFFWFCTFGLFIPSATKEALGLLGWGALVHFVSGFLTVSSYSVLTTDVPQTMMLVVLCIALQPRNLQTRESLAYLFCALATDFGAPFLAVGIFVPLTDTWKWNNDPSFGDYLVNCEIVFVSDSDISGPGVFALHSRKPY